MASILLADPTKAYFKLSLWREAAEWAERVTVGDIVYLRRKRDSIRKFPILKVCPHLTLWFTDIRLKLWSNEVVGTTVKCSSILNLHQPNKKLPQRGLGPIKLCRCCAFFMDDFNISVQESVPNFCVSSLMDWGRKTFAYLFSFPLEPKSQSKNLHIDWLDTNVL